MAVTHLVVDAGMYPVVPFLLQISLPLATSMTAPVNDVPNLVVVTRELNRLVIRVSAPGDA